MNNIIFLILIISLIYFLSQINIILRKMIDILGLLSGRNLEIVPMVLFIL